MHIHIYANNRDIMIRWRHSLNDNDDFTEKERKKYPKNQSNLVKIHTCEDSSGTYRR